MLTCDTFSKILLSGLFVSMHLAWEEPTAHILKKVLWTRPDTKGGLDLGLSGMISLISPQLQWFCFTMVSFSKQWKRYTWDKDTGWCTERWCTAPCCLLNSHGSISEHKKLYLSSLCWVKNPPEQKNPQGKRKIGKSNYLKWMSWCPIHTYILSLFYAMSLGQGFHEAVLWLASLLILQALSVLCVTGCIQ